MHTKKRISSSEILFYYTTKQFVVAEVFYILQQRMFKCCTITYNIIIDISPTQERYQYYDDK